MSSFLSCRPRAGNSSRVGAVDLCPPGRSQLVRLPAIDEQSAIVVVDGTVGLSPNVSGYTCHASLGRRAAFATRRSKTGSKSQQAMNPADQVALSTARWLLT
jgi:hypothetical protein